MRSFTFKSTLTLAAPAALALVLSACAAESESANAGEDDLPETEIAEEPEAISDGEVAEAVPGVEAVDTEGDAPSTAGVEDGDDAVYAEADGEIREGD